MGVMFPNYQFVDPRNDRTVLISKSSYLVAGFLGPAYVLFKSGPGKLVQSLGWSFGCAVGTLAFVVKGLPYVPGDLQIVALVVGIPIVFVLHSVKTVGLVRRSLRQRGWTFQRPINLSVRVPRERYVGQNDGQQHHNAHALSLPWYLSNAADASDQMRRAQS